MPIPADPAGRETYRLDRAHVFHSWSAQAALDPLVISGASGSRVMDADGKEYLDFSGQLIYTNLGHQHPAIVAAVQEQAGRLGTIAPQHAVEARSRAAALIAERTPAGLDKVFFTNGGTDANEHAIRMARLHTGRYKVLAQFRSYHGGTQTSLNVSGDPRRWATDYGNSGAVHFFGPFLYRSAFGASTEAEECRRALDHLEQLIAMEGPDAFAALILETIPGTAGVMPPPPGYLAGVRELCDRHGIVLILDEVMVGFGRTGAWFAADHYGVVPDLLTFAKGVNSGYVPLGGVAISDEIAATFAHRPYPGGLTYSGHPLACAAAVAAITTMAEQNIVERAAQLGRDLLGPALRRLQAKHPSVGDVRGLGCFWALELVVDRETREPLTPYGTVNPAMAEIGAAARDAGLLIFTSMHRIHLAPPLTCTEAEIAEGIDLLDGVLDRADRHTRPTPTARIA
ncbi:aspartate aminotransferase family protein [Micropruina sp.]|uniref:aspartate aminotransferase family protein n=1 Tax=Micropruina sp. TaxID=2737536 RepID=UPI00261865CC|nr:aspartate aminotransferase family protein [Micropruina sp.]